MILPSRSKTSGLVMPPREKEKTQPVVTSTNNVRTVGLKDFLGGGEYKVQTPGQVTLTERGYSNMPTLSGSERDHKVPVSLGGTSSNKNLQYLKTTSSGRQEGKVAVEQDVINDFKAGKISLGEARLKIATKNQQILGLTPTEKEQDISGIMKGIEKFVNFSNKVADVVDPIKNIKKFIDFSNKAGDTVDEGRKVLEAIGKGLILPEYKEDRQKGWNSGVLGTSAALQASIANFVDMAQLTPLAIKTEGTPLRDSIISSARKDQELSRAFNDLEKATGAKVVDERAFAEKIKDPNFIAEGFTQNLPNLLVSLGVSAPAAILGSPALATAGLLFGTTMALEGGFAYNEAIDFGATEEEAKKAGALTGIANGLLESIPVFKLITRSPAGKQLKRTILSRITRNILRVGKQSGLEGGTESLQEIIANAVALTYDENRDLFSGVQESAFFGALIGGISSVGMDTVQETGGKIPGLTIEDVSLEQEAKKYKSADEFIKAQGGVSNVKQNKLPEKSTLTSDELKIQETISKKDFETIVERFFPQVKDFYEDDGVVTYQDYLNKVDPRSIELELDSYESSNRAIRKLLNDDEIYIGDVVDMYKRGILRDEIKKEPFKLSVEPISDTKVPSKRLFFEPQKPVVNNKNVYNTAINKVTPTNKNEVMEARRKLYLSWASNQNLSKELGISPSELNKKIRSMTGAKVEGYDIQQRVNQGVPEQFQWTGISNSNFIVKNNITFKDVDSVVNKIEKTGGIFRTESLSKYIMNTFLSIDTRLRYDDLNFRIQNLDSALGEYSNKDLTITISRESQNTVAHEIGHYLDYRFARELGINNTTLSDGRINYDYLQEKYNLSDEHIRWAKEFNKFASNLVDKSEIGYSAKRAEYLQKPTEVFARFTAKFVDWTASKSGYNHSEIDYYNDKFSTSDFYDFIKLLQKKAEIDVKFNIKPLIKEGDGSVNKLEQLKQPTPAQIKKENINILKQELSTERDKINFIKSVGEMKQSVISDAKKKLGLKFPVTQMTLKELDMLQGELDRRLEFKVDKGFVAKGDTKLKPIPQEIYDKKDFKPFKSKSNLGKGIDKYLGVISTRLANIDISLKQKVRKLEYDNANQTQKRKEVILPFLEKTKDMSKNDWDTYDLALKNGDKAKIDEINSKYDMEGEYDSIKVLLDDIYSQLESVGYELGYKKNYFPRTIKDSNGLLDYLSGTEDWSIILEAKNKKEMELGRSLDAYELAIMVNSMIRGYSAGQITLAKTGAMKTRKIDIVDQELNQFYSDSRSSILRYIEQATEAVNAKKFFGKELEMTIDGVKKLRVEDSVGAYTTKLLAEGKITPSQELELRSILTARFAPKSTTGFGTIFKNLTYIDVMGSPLNAITQIGDLAFPLYKAGFFRTIKGIGKSIMGKSPIKKEDIGIEQIAQEFSEQSKLATAVGMVFKAIGLTKMDSIGKQTLIDAVISKMRSQAKSKDQNTQAQLRAELEKVFDKQDVSEVIQDLKSGNITENVKYLAFNKLLDFQPVALSEVPEKYLSGGNGRIFYTLKTWTIKMFDVYRNEAFQDISSGNKQQVIKGLQNLIRLSMCLVLMNATADTIKDLLLGRKIELNDLVIDNIAKLFGLSKYQLDLSSKEGIGSTLISTILPPTQLVDSAYKDINKSIKANELDIQNLATWKSVPIVGKLYYWWFGKGSEYKKSTKPKGLDLDIDLDLGLDSDIDLDLDLDLDI